jgi:hypothetical protein
MLATRSMAPGVAVHGEKRITVDSQARYGIVDAEIDSL